MTKKKQSCYGNYEEFNPICDRQCGWKKPCEVLTDLKESDNALDKALAEMEAESGPEI